jgi:phosphatidylinositol kinase/protein kinase (PI-3  family)
MGMRRERAPFVFTPAMAAVLGRTGGKNNKDKTKQLYRDFELLCCKAYNILRANTNLLITLFSLMLSCGIPELKTAQDIQWMRERLMVGKTDEEASKKFVQEIETSLRTKTTQLNDAAHLIAKA